jgi:hypothetical protein
MSLPGGDRESHLTPPRHAALLREVRTAGSSELAEGLHEP